MELSILWYVACDGGGGHNYGGVDGTLGAILTYENFSLNFTLITALTLLRAKHDNIT